VKIVKLQIILSVEEAKVFGEQSGRHLKPDKKVCGICTKDFVEYKGQCQIRQ
jgi:hypothetical protein